MLLEIEDVHVHYGKIAALKGISLGVDREADPPDRLDLPVRDVQVAHLEQRHPAGAPR